MDGMRGLNQNKGTKNSTPQTGDESILLILLIIGMLVARATIVAASRQRQVR